LDMLGIELPAFTMANKTRKCAALGTHFWAMDREKRENPILID